ncbi:DUF551 domain-containing protein [Escherichia coli]|uniref:DUF551 domain-containing protein n=4 Tax=Escherichia coli TaxID=562 RepID=UPI000450291C|nr:DUF551 domain-containing protein [Escherichia coli]EFW7514538.1 DUF551 domain-containing protein [Shigella sonnei]EEC7919083.1 DUF551 domain-containing protein [Escherichia coli]EEC9059027.1 DUF551 domain-containing protein [Escherichia coli]EEC9155877.1 DUF551 domain-containing protein [Escherichia coli]EEC9408768.1 DUF551 domain-containing protein [Escherichia coli]
MTTITKERLLTIKQWRETYGPGSNVVLPAEEAEELARIALAALEAEPVLYQSCTRPTWNSGVPWTEWKERSREGYENDLRFTDTPDHAGWINKCRKLYTTPPVPVIQADVAQAIENLKQKLVECNRYNYCADAVKGVEDACRAVSYSQADNQPASGNQAAESNRGNEWTGNPDIDNAIIMLDRIDTLENCDDDRIEAVKAVLRRLAGNSPVTPDSWISCSERMPEKGQNVLISVNFDSSLVEPLICSARYTGSTFRRGQITVAPGNGIDGNGIEQATHWMPLPEPPQEVNRG